MTTLRPYQLRLSAERCTPTARPAARHTALSRRPQKLGGQRGHRLSAVQDAGVALAPSDEEVNADLEAEIAEAEAKDQAAEAAAQPESTPQPVLSAAEEEERRVAASLAATDPATYKLNFLWLENSVAVAVDQVFGASGSGARPMSPLTEYFFWPKNDAWYELKAAIEEKPWVSELNKVLLLNQTTEVINYWQDSENKHTLEEARAAFPQCSFLGA